MAIYRMRNPIRNYDWGSRTAMTELLGVPNPRKEAQAELWMGAHPGAPSELLTEAGAERMDLLLARDGRTLPFLFKVLSAARPLSIQVHPSAEQAAAGFDREEAAGIPVDAPHRTYRDRNHKPEVIAALTRFWALKGFRQPDLIAADLELLSADTDDELFRSLSEALAASPALLLRRLLELEPGERDFIAARAMAVNDVEGDPGIPGSEMRFSWVRRIAGMFPGDPGVLAPMALHTVELQPGQGLYQPAGELHAYLEGTGIELMANSDNVLRAGITGKHVDPDELFHVADLEHHPVRILDPVDSLGGFRCYPSPAAEFRLCVLEADDVYPVAVPGSGPRILLCVRGGFNLSGAHQAEEMTLERGESLCILGESAGELQLSGAGTVYLAMEGDGGSATG